MLTGDSLGKGKGNLPIKVITREAAKNELQRAKRTSIEATHLAQLAAHTMQNRYSTSMT